MRITQAPFVSRYHATTNPNKLLWQQLANDSAPARHLSCPHKDQVAWLKLKVLRQDQCIWRICIQMVDV